MTSSRAALVATAIPLLLTSLRVTAGELPFNAPATEKARQSAPILHQAARALHDGDEAISDLWLFPTADANVVFARYNVAGSAAYHLVVMTVNGNHIVDSRELTSASADSVSNQSTQLHWSALIGTGNAARANLTPPKLASSSGPNIPPALHWTASIGTGTAAASAAAARGRRPSSGARPAIAAVNWTSRIGTGHALDSTTPGM